MKLISNSGQFCALHFTLVVFDSPKTYCLKTAASSFFHIAYTLASFIALTLQSVVPVASLTLLILNNSVPCASYHWFLIDMTQPKKHTIC